MRPRIVRFVSTLEWLGFFGLILLAWFILFRLQSSMGMPAEPEMVRPGFGIVFLMWVLMTAAMMAPSFVPSLRTFQDLTATEAANSTTRLALLAGYMLVWIGFSALAAGAQLWFTGLGVLGMDGASNNWALTALLLFAAGSYQFSPLKAACLSKCRAPLTFFMGHWWPGSTGAAHMGFQLGLACLGCCWALMSLGFVGGVMNLVWMGVATGLMVVEKLPQLGRVITAPLGIGLLGAAVFSAAKAFGY